MASTITFEIDLKSSIDKLMRIFKNARDVLPKFLPEIYKSIEFSVTNDLQIDIKIEYAKGQPINSETCRVNEILLQEAKASYNVIDGDYTKFYKSYESTVQFVEIQSTGGTKAIRTYKIERKPDSPDFHQFVEFDKSNLRKIDNINL